MGKFTTRYLTDKLPTAGLHMSPPPGSLGDEAREEADRRGQIGQRQDQGARRSASSRFTLGDRLLRLKYL